MNSLKYNLYYLESQFVGFPIVIRVTILLVSILALIYIGSLIRIFFLARTQTKLTNRETEIKNKYEKKLKTILFSNEDISSNEIKRKLGIDNESLNEWEKFHITKLMINIIRQHEKKELNTN